MNTERSTSTLDTPVGSDDVSLPNDVLTLQAMIRELLDALKKSQQECEGVRQRLDLLLRKLYGPKAERFNPEQPWLLPELAPAASEQLPNEQQPKEDSPKEDSPNGAAHKKRNGGGRKKLPDDLPRVRKEHTLPEAQRVCPCCNEVCQKFGEEISEQLDFQPGHLFVRQHVRFKYACKKCHDHVTTAHAPIAVINKGIPGPGLLAHIAASKYADHLPLHRLERILARYGIELSRKTMCDWMAHVAKVLHPVVDFMANLVRASNRNAGKKCVRGVVPNGKLLTANPWNQFDWIEGRERPIRQFDAQEIDALLDYFETSWPGVTVAELLTKFFLWSSCRQQEATGLKWASLKRIGNEVHFEIFGKWGVERWVRIPYGLFSALEAVRTESDFVFAAYNDQLRAHHENKGRHNVALKVGAEFDPLCFGDWFADRLDDWSAESPKGRAHTHVFRKTSLQYVRSGEDVNRQVANDARVSESVLMTSYVKETDEQLRQASNRTFGRMLASLPLKLARRCGHDGAGGDLEVRLRQAIEAQDWKTAASLTARLARQRPTKAS